MLTILNVLCLISAQIYEHPFITFFGIYGIYLTTTIAQNLWIISQVIWLKKIAPLFQIKTNIQSLWNCFDENCYYDIKLYKFDALSFSIKII